VSDTGQRRVGNAPHATSVRPPNHFFDNDKVNLDKILHPHIQKSVDRIKALVEDSAAEKVVLLVQGESSAWRDSDRMDSAGDIADRHAGTGSPDRRLLLREMEHRVVFSDAQGWLPNRAAPL